MMRMTSLVFVCASFMTACSWGEGSGSEPAIDAPIQVAQCGDGVCSASEVTGCPADCGTGGGSGSNAVCGNGTCEMAQGETSASCPTDCPIGGGGSGSGSGSGSTCSPPPASIEECFGCIIPGSPCPGGTIDACIACAGGLGSGSGLPF